MVTIEEFQEKVDNTKTDDELLFITRKYIFHGIPFVFQDREDDYYDFRNEIANNFKIDYRDVIIVGSAKLGYSWFKRTPFSHESDIDVALINTQLFDKFHRSICDFQYKIRHGQIRLTSDEQAEYNKLLRYMAIGWLRPDKIPYQLEYIGRKSWFDFFNSISYGKRPVGDYKVNAGLFKNNFFFEKYYVNALKSIKN